MNRIILAAATALLSAGAAFAAPVTTVSTGLGDVLAGENGMTLYTFKKDEPGKSNCYDKCATNWPPLLAKAGDAADGSYTIIERTGGEMQWAKNGKPLYFWVKDMKKGDTTGQGVAELWEVARP